MEIYSHLVMIVTIFVLFKTAQSIGKDIGTFGVAQIRSTVPGQMFFRISKLFISMGIIFVFLPVSPWPVDKLIFKILKYYDSPSYPTWFNIFGFREYLIVFTGFLAGFIRGRQIKSATYPFNKGRKMYENAVKKFGYWFPEGWKDLESLRVKSTVDQIANLYNQTAEMMQKEREAPGHKHKIDWDEREYVFHYQRALFEASRKNFKDALCAYKKAYYFFEKSRNLEHLLLDTVKERESQLLFLEGELYFVMGDKVRAKNLWKRCVEIDSQRKDRAGLHVLAARLALT